MIRETGLPTPEMMPEDEERKRVVVRLAGAEDAAGINDVQKAAWLDTYPNEEAGITREDILSRDWDNPERIRRRQESLKTDTGTIVAVEGGKVVGFAIINIDDAQNRLQAMYVHPSYQGRGVGRHLMEQALGMLDQNRDVVLNVVKYNQNAIEYYKHFGFEETGKRVDNVDRPLPTGKVFPEIEMIRKAQGREVS